MTALMLIVMAINDPTSVYENAHYRLYEITAGVLAATACQRLVGPLLGLTLAKNDRGGGDKAEKAVLSPVQERELITTALIGGLLPVVNRVAGMISGVLILNVICLVVGTGRRGLSLTPRPKRHFCRIRHFVPRPQRNSSAYFHGARFLTSGSCANILQRPADGDNGSSQTMVLTARSQARQSPLLARGPDRHRSAYAGQWTKHDWNGVGLGE